MLFLAAPRHIDRAGQGVGRGVAITHPGYADAAR